MANPTNPLEFQNRDQWRQWLVENHARAAEAWLTLYRKMFADQGLALSPSRRQQLIYLLQSAKAAETRQRRIEKIVISLPGQP